MQSFKRTIATRALAWVLAFVMVFTMIPYGAFAAGEAGEDKLSLAPSKGPVAVRDAAPPIESQVGNDARNAVHAFVGVQTGGDLNLPLADATGQQFTPIPGVKAYFQWFEDGGYVSPIYTATSDANGRLNIGCTPYLAPDGKLIKFDADPTVSAGHEKYRFWVEETTIPEGYQLQYITGENIIFPKGPATVTQGGSGSDTPKNTHENWKILLMQKPKAEMHRTDAKETPVQSKTGGYLKGKVSWDYTSDAGGVNWKFVADHTEPAPGVTVRASYLSDYALKKIYSNDAVLAIGGISKPEDIRGSKWTSAHEEKLQKWIKEQIAKEPEKWIAETVTAKTGPDGKYVIQFNGTWGVYKNADAALKTYDYKVGDKAGGIEIGNKWTQDQIDRLGTVADSSNNGAFDTVKKNEIKHINYDWLFVSTDGTEDLRVMTPYNNNYYTQMHDKWGIHSGWSGGSFGLGVTLATNCTLEADFVFGPGEIDFHITNYDNDANTAIPGDVAETSTTGLPYSFTSDKYQIVWYGPDGKKIDGKQGEAQQASSTGTLPSAPFDTTGVTKTTEYTAKLHRVDSKGNLQDPIAIDSFTVEVSNFIGSRYDLFEHKNANPVKGAAYTAENLPDGLTIDAGNGNISGKPTTAGLYDVTVTASMDDTDEGKVVGKITGSRTHKYLITDSPLADGAKGTEYNQKVVPTPQKGYVFKNVTAKFIDGKSIDGLTITGDQISGTPKAEVKATEDDPNVEVTYDIYRKNDKGEEVLIKKGHVDKVPLSIKNGDSAKYEPEYTAVNGTVGTPATVAAPTFKDADGKPATPQNVTYELGKGAPTGAQVNADGSVTYTPVEGDAGNAVEIPVVVKYSDGSTDNVNAVINVAQNATTADKVKELGGLSPQTIKVWKGDKFDWPDGVVPANDTNSDAVKALLVDAEITDKQNPARDSSTAGKHEGTLLVTFADGSSIEVPDQMLIVSDHIVTVDPNDPDSPKVDELPNGKIKVTFNKGEGIANIDTKGKTTFAKPNAVLADTDFPADIEYVDGYKKEVTWTPTDYKVDTSNRKYYDGKRQTFKFFASATLPDIIDRTGNEDKPTPDGYVRVTFTNGEGVNAIENNKVYDVKIGTALTADKYPTVTAEDGYENPVWSTPAGTAITADNATITATATATTPGKDTTKPEIGDLDDDNDPNTPVNPKEDENNKGPQVWANGARVVEGKEITPIKVNVTDDKDENPTVDVTGLPEGLSYNKDTKQIEGTPDKLTDWADTEEERDVTATITAKDAAGNESTKEIQITVLRDTDGDGIPDTTDPDDDNDGINDDKDKNPKAWDANVEGKVTTPKGTQPTVDQYKEKITNLPKGSEVAVKTEPDVSKAGDVEAVVTVTLPNGEKVDVTVPVTVTDTAPAEKTATPTITAPKAGDKTITGTSEPNASVEVTLPDGTKVTTTADNDGKWTANVPAGSEPKEGEVVKAVATVDGKTSSEEATATTGKADQPAVPSIENPEAKNKPGKDSTTVTGKTDPNTEVTVTDKDGTVIGTGTSDQNGDFTIDVKPKQEPGTEVTITPKDGTPAKATVTEENPNQSEAPRIIRPVEGDKAITGTGVPGAKIVVTDERGNIIGETVVNKYGNWSVPVPANRPLRSGETITATQTEKGKTPAQTTTTVKAKGYSGNSGGYWIIPSTPTTPSVEKPKHETAIHKLYIYGYEDNTFKPEGNMTRAEAAAMLARLQGLDLSNTARPNFIDVRSGWYNAVINAVVNAGYMKGYPDGTFRPDGKITRAEFAQMIKAIDKANSGMAPFADVKGHWAQNAIDQAYANKRITGYPDGTFRPNNHITRAEAVTVFNKLYDRSVNFSGLNGVKDAIVPFNDVTASHWAYYEIVESSNTHEFYRTEKGLVPETWVTLIQTWKQALANR